MKPVMQTLVSASYKNGNLDGQTVKKIAAQLNRKELKAYIRGLRNNEKKTTVSVEIADPKIKVDEKALQNVFGKKKIRKQVNSDLLLGLRITDNDDVYNMNLQDTLERIEDYATE